MSDTIEENKIKSNLTITPQYGHFWLVDAQKILQKAYGIDGDLEVLGESPLPALKQ